MAIQKSYYCVILGRGHKYANECYQGKFIGAHYDGFDFDLSDDLSEDWRDFNAKFRDTFLKHNPNKTNIAAGLACGALWTVCKGIKKGDIVLCPNGLDEYWVGEVISDYVFQADSFFLHQRKVAWMPTVIARADMSSRLRKSTKSFSSAFGITKYAEEIEGFISGASRPQLIATDESVEDASEFALEKHLEDFLVQNWESTELGKITTFTKTMASLSGNNFQAIPVPLIFSPSAKTKKSF